MDNPPKTPELTKGIKSFVERAFNDLQSYEGEPHFFVEKVFKLADVIYKHQVKPIAVCPTSGGCSHCCKVPVQITALEADYIHRKAGVEPKDLKGVSVHSPDNSPCPFLKNDNCSIYEFRPLACRTFASLDTIEACIDPRNSHWIATINGNGAFKHLHDTLISASEATPYAAFADIRHWFGMTPINIKNI